VLGNQPRDSISGIVNKNNSNEIVLDGAGKDAGGGGKDKVKNKTLYNNFQSFKQLANSKKEIYQAFKSSSIESEGNKIAHQNLKTATLKKQLQ
jgi:hypothetical protein